MRWYRAALLVALVTVVLYLAVLNYSVERWNRPFLLANENKRHMVQTNDRPEDERTEQPRLLLPSLEEGEETPLEVSGSLPAPTPKESEPAGKDDWPISEKGMSYGEQPPPEPADVQGVTEQQAPEYVGGEEAPVPAEQQEKWAPKPPEKITKAAVLCVPGPNELIPVVVRNALENLPKDWKIQVFHRYLPRSRFILLSIAWLTVPMRCSPNMTTELMESPDLRPFWEQGRIHLTPTLSADMTHYGYSQHLMTTEFWDQVCCAYSLVDGQFFTILSRFSHLGEYMLMIQTDSIICSKSPSRIDDFTRYDYIGAPWDWSAELLGGNGGTCSLDGRHVQLCRSEV